VATRADDLKLAHPPDTVTIVYRGQTHSLTGRNAENLSRAALRLLADSRTERALTDNQDLRRHFETAQKRSCIILRFATPHSVPKSARAAASVKVEQLVIPFSPDLDPQAVFVLPGQPARAFTDFRLDSCDDLRTMLVHARIYPAAPGAVVKGLVLVTGQPPAPRSWEVDRAIKQKFGLTHYTEETWQVGPTGGLRHCVVTLRDSNPDRRMTPLPLEAALMQKDMVRYHPHVLVVTPLTPIVLANPEGSPCRGFHITGSKQLAGNQFSYMIGEDEEKTIRPHGPDICKVTCPVRPYALGYIHVVDTAYFALTDPDGRFTVRGIPAGMYDVTIWHEGIGRLPKEAGPVQVSVTEQGEQALSYNLAVPGSDRK
jgi:hypothetical protein